MRVQYAIVFVSDMERSVAFYRDTLEIPLKFESLGWTEFATEGSTLALHKSEPADPSDKPSGLERAGQCRWGFQVKDLNVFHNRMLEYNVPCIEEPQSVFGSRVAQYTDPDGMVFSVGEEKKN